MDCVQSVNVNATSEPLALTLRACFALPFAFCVCLSLLACCCTALLLHARPPVAPPCPATHAPPLPTPRPARERPEGLRRRRAVAALRLSCARENCTVCTAPRLCPPTTAHEPPPPPTTSLPRPATTTATPPTHRSLLLLPSLRCVRPTDRHPFHALRLACLPFQPVRPDPSTLACLQQHLFDYHSSFSRPAPFSTAS